MTARAGISERLKSLQRPFLPLLLALAAVFFLVPILGGESRPRPTLDLLFSLVLVAGVGAATGSRVHLRVGLGLGALALATRWLVYASPDALAVMLLSNLAFFGFTALAVFSAVARQRQVSSDTITGGICVYLLLAVLWALMFQLVEVFEPGSFGLPDGAASPSLRDLLYFSMVTMTTLGYGDILPVSSPARALASGEAIFGQLFVAIFIARLVGLYAAQQHKNRSSD